VASSSGLERLVSYTAISESFKLKQGDVFRMPAPLTFLGLSYIDLVFAVMMMWRAGLFFFSRDPYPIWSRKGLLWQTITSRCMKRTLLRHLRISSPSVITRRFHAFAHSIRRLAGELNASAEVLTRPYPAVAEIRCSPCCLITGLMAYNNFGGTPSLKLLQSVASLDERLSTNLVEKLRLPRERALFQY